MASHRAISVPALLLFAPLVWLGSCHALDPPAHEVHAVLETASVPSPGDAADDPAFWLDPDDPARSLILGTDKDGGLAVYDLEGRQLQYVDDGEYNNVDLRDGFPFPDGPGTLVAAGDRDDEALVLFRIDPVLRRLCRLPKGKIDPGVEPEGVAMYRSPRTGAFHVFLTGDDKETNAGSVEQWLLEPGVDRPVTARLVRRFQVGEGSACEGTVADDRTATLYVAEEHVGIWRFGAEPDAAAGGTLVARAGVTRKEAAARGWGSAGGGATVLHNRNATPAAPFHNRNATPLS